jgi:hypothetical protein
MAQPPSAARATSAIVINKLRPLGQVRWSKPPNLAPFSRLTHKGTKSKAAARAKKR